MSELSVAELLARYREAAEKSADPDEAAASRWAYQVHTYYKQLRDTDEGKRGLVALMADVNPQVRRWAAVHCLGWERQAARAVLRQLG